MVLQASLKAKRAANQKSLKPEARVASLKHILRLHRYMDMYASSGLQMFQNSDKLESLNLRIGCETGRWPDPMPRIPADMVVACLCVATDEEQYQITAGEFITASKPEGLGCTGVRFRDEFHRWNNDLNNAVAFAGLATVEKAGTLIFNIGYGPWQKAAWYHMILASGQKIAQTIQPNSRMVLRFWPRHLVDNGLVGTTDDAIVGQEGRRQYIAGVPRQNLLHLKGGRVSPSAWMSFQKVGAEWSSSIATRAMVLATLCLEKGWVLTEEDLFAPTRCGVETSCEKDASGDKLAPKSKAEALRVAKAKVEALKMRTANLFVAATKLLADIDVINGIRIILHAGRAQSTGFAKLVDDLTTPAKSLALAQSWARQEWLQPLKDTLACLTDVRGLIGCGFHADFKVEEVRAMSEDAPTIRYQDALARRLGRLVDCILEKRSGSMAQRSFYYPFKLAGLTSTDESVRREAMREFEKDVRALWAAKDL